MKNVLREYDVKLNRNSKHYYSAIKAEDVHLSDGYFFFTIGDTTVATALASEVDAITSKEIPSEV